MDKGKANSDSSNGPVSKWQVGAIFTFASIMTGVLAMASDIREATKCYF